MNLQRCPLSTNSPATEWRDWIATLSNEDVDKYSRQVALELKASPMGKLVVIDSAFNAEKARRFDTMRETITSLSDEINQTRGHLEAARRSLNGFTHSEDPKEVAMAKADRGGAFT